MLGQAKGKNQGGSGGRKSKGKAWVGIFFVVGKKRLGKHLRLASSNNFSGS